MILIYTGEYFYCQYLFGSVSHSTTASRPTACPPLAVLLNRNTLTWMGKKGTVLHWKSAQKWSSYCAELVVVS